MRYKLHSLLLSALLIGMAGCSSSPAPSKEAKDASPYGPGPAVNVGKNPLAKYIELAGFRISESSAGKLKIKFAAINHSDAELEELTVKVRLMASTAKPGDAPVTEFEVKIPPLGPEEVKEVAASSMTKLRLYELPDWQFLRADFDITSPAP